MAQMYLIARGEGPCTTYKPLPSWKETQGWGRVNLAQRFGMLCFCDTVNYFHPWLIWLIASEDWDDNDREDISYDF
ncbi:hypothetical protein I3843_06G006600 [Carya illinoinensis]|uniref:Uncharacterized protein n=1 Tax=Carya illinoinensis TaxID=32201 RepID=A0A922JFQ2_CARIL|nr:hypothetical protein I3842_06G006600 [Carya illinoinensis]KAG7973625.1 hypothetical protein I3843_06G006600 [Carya illinoinensis]